MGIPAPLATRAAGYMEGIGVLMYIVSGSIFHIPKELRPYGPWNGLNNWGRYGSFHKHLEMCVDDCSNVNIFFQWQVETTDKIMNSQSNHMSNKVGFELLIHSQTSMIAPVKFENELLISFNILKQI